MKTFNALTIAVLVLLVGAAPAAAAPFSLYGLSRLDYAAPDDLSGALKAWQEPGPWVWGDFKATALAGWDERSTYTYTYTLGAGVPEGNNVFSQTISSHSVIIAYDAQNKAIGTLEFDGQGKIYADLEAAHAIVDPDGGAILYGVGGVGGLPGQSETGHVTGATGVFASQVSIGQELQLHISGYSVKDLIPGMPLQDNIFAAPSHTFFSEFAIVSVPEPSGLAISIAAFGAGAFLGIRRRYRYH